MPYFSTGAALTASLNALPAGVVGSYKAFDPFFYASQYMTSYSGTLTPIEHFVQIGAARGNKPNSDFDPVYYQQKYPDLANLDAADLLFHYVKFGLSEGRPGNAALGSVNWSTYLTSNPDVATYVNANLASFGGSVTNGAIAHYVKFGVAEGRSVPGVVTGQTFTLTTGVDVSGTLKGDAGTNSTAGNDVFNASLGSSATLNSFDNLNGGSGEDTLNIASTPATLFTMPASLTLAGFENVNVSHAGTGGTNAVTVTNTTFGTGVKKFSYVEAGSGTTAAVAVTLDSATDVSVVSTGVTFTTADITDKSTTAASTGSTLKNITLTKVNGAQTLTGNAIDTLNLNTQGTAVATITAAAGTRALTVNTAGTGNITGVTDAQATSLTLNNTGAQTLGTYTVAKAATVNVSTTAAATGLVITAATAKTLNISGTNTVAAVITGSVALTDINISGAGAGLTSVVDLSGIATNLANITSTATTTGSGTTKVGAVTLGATTVTAGFGVNVAFTGGAGDDIITVGATTKAINVGGGANKVHMLAGTTALATGGSITATTGTTDTLVVTNLDAVALTVAAVGTAFKAVVTGFETLDIGAAAADNTISMTAFGSFNELAFTTAAQTTTISGLTSGKTITATLGAAAVTSLTTNNLSGGQDTLTINLKADLSGGARAFGTFTTPGVEVVTINMVDSNATFAAQAATVTVVDTAAQSLIVTGNNGVTVTSASTALFNVDASGLTKGAFSFTSGALVTDTTAKGSVSGGDTLDFALTTAAKVSITAYAGANTLKGGSLVDTIVGGSGVDTITGGLGNDVLTGGAGADNFLMVTAVANGTDSITDFARGTGGDKFSISVAATGISALKNGNSAAVLAAATVGVKAATAATTLVAGDNVIVLAGATFANAAAAQTAIEVGGSRALTFGSATTANDDIILVWSDGTLGHISLVNIGSAATTITAGQSTIADAATLVGVTSIGATDFVAANFAFIA